MSRPGCDDIWDEQLLKSVENNILHDMEFDGGFASSERLNMADELTCSEPFCPINTGYSITHAKYPQCIVCCVGLFCRFTMRNYPAFLCLLFTPDN